MRQAAPREKSQRVEAGGFEYSAKAFLRFATWATMTDSEIALPIRRGRTSFADQGPYPLKVFLLALRQERRASDLDQHSAPVAFGEADGRAGEPLDQASRGAGVFAQLHGGERAATRPREGQQQLVL